MARKQHLLDAEQLKELSSFNYDDWSWKEVQLFDQWIFKAGKWDYSQSWVDYSRPGKAKLIMHMAAYLAHILAKENNTP